MSSLTRRIYIRALKKAGKSKLPVISANGQALGSRWSTRKGDLFFLPTGVAVRFGDTHPTLQPIIDILEDDVVRKIAATP